MILENKIDLYAYFGVKRPEGAKGYMNAYITERFDEYSAKRFRPAMIVFPGGGYWFRSEREAQPIALNYAVNGFQAFVVEYTVESESPNAHHPVMLIEAAMAVAYVRENADKYFIQKDKIAVIGFSAGGHLAGSISTIFGDENIVNALKEKAALCRPDASVLCYPVITFIHPTHGGTRDACTNHNPALFEALSVEKNVTENTPPTFIWSTYEDNCVPIINSVLMAEALAENKVPFELHIFRKGYHGLSLCNDETSKDGVDAINPVAEEWLKMSVTFLRELGFKVRNEE